MAEAVYEVMVKDETKDGLDEVNRNFRKTAQEAGGLTGGIKQLSGALGLSPGGLAAVAGIAGAALSVHFVSGIISANAEISRMSQTLGINSETLQGWQFAAEQSGTSLETVSDASRTFSERILEASQGSADAKEQFDLLGLSARQLSRLTEEEQFLELADALSEVETESERVAIAQALLGDAGSELLVLFENGAVGIEEYVERARELGIVLDEDAIEASRRAEEAVGTLTSAFEGVVNQIVSALAPTIEDVANILTDDVVPVIVDEVVPAFRDFTEENLPKLVDFIRDDLIPAFISFVEDTLPEIEEFVGDVIVATEDIVEALDGLIDFVEGSFSADWELAWEGIEQIASDATISAGQGVADLASGTKLLPAPIRAAGAAWGFLLDIIDGGSDIEDAEAALKDAASSADDFNFSLGNIDDTAFYLQPQITETSRLIRDLKAAADEATPASRRLAEALAIQAVAAGAAAGDIGIDVAGDELSGLISTLRIYEATGVVAAPSGQSGSFGSPFNRGGRPTGGGGGGGGTDTPRVEESPEQRRQRLREEQEIRLLNQGITGGSLDLLLRLFDQDLALDDAGLRGARLAGGGQTQFEASLAGLLERRAQAASDKRERDRDTAAAERQAERDADKAEREAQRDADRADRDLRRQIDRQFANLADLAGLGLDTTEINRLQQLFDAEVGLTERQRDTLRIGGGGRTPYEQARFEAEERIREMAEALKKAMKEVDEENNRVCPPNAMTAHETVRSLEAVGRRGHIRSSRQGAEGLC